MTDAGTTPALSVVISTMDDPGTVIGRYEDLRRQVSGIKGELIVVSGGASGSALPPPGVHVHHVPGGSIFDCRAAGLSLASGPIIAFTEDHCAHPQDWCERILHNFSRRPDLVLLGGAVANGSDRTIDERSNYWTTFATFAPGQVTSQHPCIAQFIVKAAAVEQTLRPGELEYSLIPMLAKNPGAIFVDPDLVVRHEQSHGFWRTFAVHFHNGRATGGYSPRRAGGDPSLRRALRWSWQATREHFGRSNAAFRAGGKPLLRRAGYMLLILPLIAVQGIGAFVGCRKGPGASPHRLV